MNQNKLVTKQYDIIHLPDGYMYGIDKKVGIKEGDYHYYKGKTPLIKHLEGISKVNQIKIGYSNTQNNKWYLGNAVVNEFHNDCFKIIFTNNPSLGLPLLPDIEEDVEKLAKNASIKYCEKWWPNQSDRYIDAALINHTNGFLEGYKAASAKKYTEEDIRKAIDFGEAMRGEKSTINENFGSPFIEYEGAQKEIETYIQSLFPKPIAVEVEMIDNGHEVDMEGRGGSDIGWLEKWEPKIIFNKVQVKQWIYEKKEQN